MFVHQVFAFTGQVGCHNENSDLKRQRRKPRVKNAWSIIRALWYEWLADERPLNTLHMPVTRLHDVTVYAPAMQRVYTMGPNKNSNGHGAHFAD